MTADQSETPAKPKKTGSNSIKSQRFKNLNMSAAGIEFRANLHEKFGREIARRGMALGIHPEDDLEILRMCVRLADLEIEYTGSEQLFGFAKYFGAQAGRKALQTSFVKRSKKYWKSGPLIQGDDESDRIARIIQKAGVALVIDPLADIPRPPRRFGKVVPFDPIGLVYQVHFEQAYDPAAVQMSLHQYLSARLETGNVQFKDAVAAGSVIDFEVTQTALTSEIVELLNGVSWIVRVFTKPSSMFGKMLPVPTRRYGFVL